MKNKRKLYKGKSRANLGIIKKHIQSNMKEYVVAAVVFISGIIVGMVMVNNSSQDSQNEINGYISNFINTIKNGEYTIDGSKLLCKSILANLEFAFFIWIAGSTIIGLPITYLLLGYKGLCAGYTISAMMSTLGKTKGLIFSISAMLPQNLVAIPCFIALAVSSSKVYKIIIKKRYKEDVKSELYRHTIFSLFMTAGLVLSSFVECIFTVLFFSDIITNFV